jgi:2-keto-4-pentenoate hydratase
MPGDCMLSVVITTVPAMPDPLDLAARLLDVYRTRSALAADPQSGPADVAQAYAVQRAVWRAMTHGARPAVWKVGAPNRQTEPTAAAIFPLRVAHCAAAQPARFAVGEFLALGGEAEIALRFGRDLPARDQPYGADEIRAAITSAHVVMELVDTRLADADAAGPLWRLADSLLNGGLVIGAAIANWREQRFSDLTVRIDVDGQRLIETVGRPPLDDLLYCLPWWLARNGGARAGDIVTTGAWNGMHRISMPAEVRVEFVGVGDIVALIE